MATRNSAASWLARVAIATAILTSIGLLAAPASALPQAPAALAAS
ncbi:MAG: hypothetical protein ABTQ31_15590 [Rhizobiaceae bacterium]